MTTIAISPVFS